jgi:hypothetical protein
MVAPGTQASFPVSREESGQTPNKPAATPAGDSAAPQPNRRFLFEGDFAPVCFTFFLGLVFLDLLNLGLAKWYRPDTARLIREATELVIPAAVPALAPEPAERLQYVLSVILTPLFLFGCLLALKRHHRGATQRNRRVQTWVAAALLVVGTVAVPILAYLSLEKRNFLYVRAGVLFTHCPTYTLLFFPGLSLLAFFAHKRWISWAGKTALYALSAYLAAIVFFAVMFDRDSIDAWTLDLNPVIYPLAQVLAGKTLLVNCASLYGLFPLFLQPIYEVFPLSVYSFTLVMAALLVVCLAAVWFFLRTAVRNDYVFLAGFTAAVFYAYAGPRTLGADFRPDPYFQYAPIRLLFPCLLLALSALYLRGAGKRWLYHAIFLFSALATLWNPDTGLVVWGAWLLLLAYVELFRQPWQAAAGPILAQWLTACGSLLLVYGGYSLFAFLRSGAWPDWGMSIKYYKLFSHNGYFMLPMPGLPHLWGIIVGVYVAAMVVALHGLLRKENELLCRNLFLLAVMGAGLFSYYNGRSHSYCLIPLLYVPILILTLLADHILTGVKDGNRTYYKYLPLGALGFYFCASAVPSVFTFTLSRRYLGWIHEGSVASSAGAHGVHSRNIEFIRRQTKRGEKILILLGDATDGMYHAESATASVLDLPSSTDWVFKSDVNQVWDFLRGNKSGKVFVTRQYAGQTELLKNCYRIAAEEGQTGLVMLLPAASAPAGSPPP